jgi:hypothetical protein
VDYVPLVPKFVAVTFAPIAAFARRLHGDYLAAEVKRQRMKEIVHVMQVAHAQELCELDVSEWPLKILVGKQKAEDNRRPAATFVLRQSAYTVQLRAKPRVPQTARGPLIPGVLAARQDEVSRS